MIPLMPFGRTGHDSSRVIFGAAGLWDGEWGFDWAAAVLDAAAEAGVNHIDTAASYGDSELLLAPWLRDHRREVFLATKTGERGGEAARAELELSLSRLGVDSVDMIQLHNLVEEDEWRAAHSTGGALEAMLAARDEGLVRFIGVTGHGTRIAAMHSRSLAEFDYDSVLFPWNYTLACDSSYRQDVDELMATCLERGVAAQTIKSIARRRWPEQGTSDVEERRSWYQPLRDSEPIGRAMQFVLSDERMFLNTSSDTRLMSEMLSAAGRILAGGPVVSPPGGALDADVAGYGMEPLFDGAERERI